MFRVINEQNKEEERKPAGASELGPKNGYWGSYGTQSSAYCELCKTTHREYLDEDDDIEDESLSIVWYRGYQIVEECCGAVIDKAFLADGRMFTEAFK